MLNRVFLLLLTAVPASLAADCIGTEVVSYGTPSTSHGTVSGILTVTFPATVSGWRFVVLFDHPVNRLETWKARAIQKSPTKWVLRHQNWNRHQQAGNTLDINFNEHFTPNTVMPVMTSVKITGIEICTDASVVITTTAHPNAGVCEAAGIITENNVWNTGMTVGIRLPFNDPVTSWNLEITFTRPVDRIESWVTTPATTTDNLVWSLTNNNNNGVQSAGSILDFVINAHFDLKPDIVSVKLNGVELCVNPGVTTAVTTAATTAATSEATTAVTTAPTTAPSTEPPTTASTAATTPGATTPAGTDCISQGILVERTVWNEGESLDIHIPFDSAVTSWALEVVFDRPLTDLETWVVDPATSDNRIFTLTSLNYNSVQQAGNTYTVAMNALFPNGSKAEVVSISLNGVDLCMWNGGTTITGTTIASTTPVTTAATTAATTAGTTAATTAGTTAATTAGTTAATTAGTTAATTAGTTAATTAGTTAATTAATTAGTTAATTAGTTAATTAGPTGVTTGATTISPDNFPYNYNMVLEKSLLFYEAQRSGPLPANNRVPWRGDSALQDGAQCGLDLTGGYYDAGDHVKFGFPMAGMTTVLAWGAIDFADGYRAAGQMQYVMEAIKWATDYFIKCHPSPNVFYGQVADGDIDHAWWGRPEEMPMERPCMKITTSAPGSELAAETAAAMAAASLVFRDSNSSYADLLLSHARELYTFADQFRGEYHNSIVDAASFYKSWSGYGDELCWAAAWLYKVTGEQAYLTAAETHFQQFGALQQRATEFSWDGKHAGAQVLLYQLTQKLQYESLVTQFCDWLVSGAPRTPQGQVFLQPWGSLRHAANAALICLEAAEAGLNPTAYRALAREQIGLMLGDAGRSYVVGFGNNPPQRPHHKAASCPSTGTCGWDQLNTPNPNPHVLNGALVGGPDASGNYADVRTDYVKNEVTCDYNAGFQSVVAGLVQLHANGITP